MIRVPCLAPAGLFLVLVLTATPACESGGGGGGGDDRSTHDDDGAGDGDDGAGGDVGSCLETSLLVTRVIDGDTIVVAMGGVSETVRIVGIDTPELTPAPEPCAQAARDFTAAQIGSGDEARVELIYNSTCAADPLVECRDVYDRLLAFVRLYSCDDLGGLLLDAGLAHVFRAFPFDRREEYDDREAEAELAGVGVHGAGCD